MIPWVREKFAESRLRWQNRKQQRSELIAPSPLLSPSISTVSADDVRPHVSPTIVRRLDSIDEMPAPTTSAYLEIQSGKRRPSSDHVVAEGNTTNQLVRRDFSFIHHQTYGKLGAENHRGLGYELPVESARLINLHIVNSTGAKITICLPLTLTGVDVKKKAIQMFCHEQFHSCDVNNIIEVSQQFKLTRISNLHGHFEETTSLAAANVQNDEEMLLTQRNLACVSANRPPLHDGHLRFSDYCYDSDNTNESLAGPTQENIEMATADVDAKAGMAIPAIVNIDELVLQSDMQYDIRKIVISLANASAYVIGAGPYASRIIFMLKQRLMQRRRLESDTQQCLVDMGFDACIVHHALHINNNIYAAALEWLIEHQSPADLALSTDCQSSVSMRVSSKFTNDSCVRDRIESLLDIIRIYCQRDIPPSNEMIRLIIDMGFDEASAREALRASKNHQSYACEWLVGNRSKIHQAEQIDGLPLDSPILKALLGSPHVQMSLSCPKMFIAYLSILEDYSTMSMWLGDSETAGIIGHILRTYHEEKHILAINQFNATEMSADAQ